MDKVISAQEKGQGDRLGPVRVWLYALALMVLLMVMVGGATRLTDSGLSITEWKPISGVLPPLSVEDWQAEFEAYKQIPEYELVNKGMGLEAFKSIFWWEWGHRLLGRAIGLAFIVPFVIFLFQRRIPNRLGPALTGLFILGGAQGVLGWWMVTSGLTERVDVSHYRLAAHLGAAAFLLMALVFVARRIRPVVSERAHSGRWPVILVTALAFLQLLAGAFVAGLDAGYIQNTWPHMDGGLFPRDMWILDPAWLNFFENPDGVQFAHRTLAYLLVAAVLWLAWSRYRQTGWQGPDGWAAIAAALVLLQAGLGIATLLLVVPISLALMHQATAFVLLGVFAAWLADTSHLRLR